MEHQHIKEFRKHDEIAAFKLCRLTVRPCHQATHDRTQKFGLQLIRRLAVPFLSPGGFWAENQQPRKIT